LNNGSWHGFKCNLKIYSPQSFSNFLVHSKQNWYLSSSKLILIIKGEFMKLYILRHAIAVERGTPGFEDDSKRPLTSGGKDKMRQSSKGIKALDLTFDLILSSPYIRAKETALIVMDVLKIKNNSLIFSEELTPEASYEKLVRELNSYSKKSKNILLVGHEPHLSGLISYLLTGKKDVTINFKKGGLCLLTIEELCSPGSASLEWILTPSQLSQMG
jgi:phosphohistidine phosphatase